MSSPSALPSDLLEEVIDYHNRKNSVIGLKPFSNKINYFVITFASSFGSLYITSSIQMILFEQLKLLLFVRAIVVLPFAIQLIYKSWLIVTNIKRFNALMEYLRIMYREQQENHSKRDILFFLIRRLFLLFKFLGVVYILTGLVFLLQPFIVKYVFNKKLYPILPALLHFTNIETAFGYCVNYFFHFMNTMYAVSGTWIFDTMFILFVMHYYILHKILIRNLYELEILVMNPEEKQETINTLLVTIFQLHIRMKKLCF